MLVTLVTVEMILIAFVEFCVSGRPFGAVLVTPELLKVALLGWLG